LFLIRIPDSRLEKSPQARAGLASTEGHLEWAAFRPRTFLLSPCVNSMAGVAQKMIFKPNSPMRPLCAPLGWRKLLATKPNSLLPFTQSSAPEFTSYPQELLFTPVHCGWLKTLNPSARNSIAFDSPILKCLNNPMSKLRRPGPIRELRPESPKVRPVGCA